MKPHIFHLRDGGRKWWVIHNGTDRVCSRLGETQASVVARWESAFGKPPGGYVRVSGYCRPSEAAAHIMTLVVDAPSE